MRFFTAFTFVLLFAVSIFAQQRAEVTVMSTHVRAAPDQKSDKVITVEKGEIVTLEKKRDTNGWFYILVSSKNIKGWIRKDTIRLLEKSESVETAKTAETTAKREKTEKPERTKKPSKPAEKDKSEKPIPAAQIDNSPNAAENPISAAPPPDETPIEDAEVLQIDTEEVNLSVRVVDDKNRAVGNLNQTHFKVYEDDILQPITALTTTEIPMTSALVIDNSRSLRTQLGKVIEAGKIIIGANRARDESTVVRFISANKIEILQDFTANKSSLGYALDNMFVEGGQTAIIDAVYLAAKKVEEYRKSENKEDVRLRALILVSDGDDRSSKYQEQELFKLLRESNVQIYVVGFSAALSQKPETGEISRQEKAKSFLTRLAQETGGKVYFPASPDDLAQIAADISGELRTQYLISYAPTNESRDGKFRQIRVEVSGDANNSKRTAITRTGRNSLSQQ